MQIENKSALLSCDCDLKELGKLLRKEKIAEFKDAGALKICVNYAIGYSLPSITAIVKEITDKPVIFDLQTFVQGNIITDFCKLLPYLKKKFEQRELRFDMPDAVTLLPAYKDMKTVVASLKELGLEPIIGGDVEKDYFNKNFFLSTYFYSAIEGVDKFYIPEEMIGGIDKYYRLIKNGYEQAGMKLEPTFFSRGFAPGKGYGEIRLWHPVVDILQFKKNKENEILGDMNKKLDLEDLDLLGVRE